MSFLLPFLLPPLRDEYSDEIPFDPFPVDLLGTTDAQWEADRLRQTLAETSENLTPYKIIPGQWVEDGDETTETPNVIFRITQTASPWLLPCTFRDSPRLLAWIGNLLPPSYKKSRKLDGSSKQAYRNALSMCRARLAQESIEDIERLQAEYEVVCEIYNHRSHMPCEKELYQLSRQVEAFQNDNEALKMIFNNPRVPLVCMTSVWNDDLIEEDLQFARAAIQDEQSFLSFPDPAKMLRLQHDLNRRGLAVYLKMPKRRRVINLSNATKNISKQPFNILMKYSSQEIENPIDQGGDDCQIVNDFRPPPSVPYPYPIDIYSCPDEDEGQRYKIDHVSRLPSLLSQKPMFSLKQHVEVPRRARRPWTT